MRTSNYHNVVCDETGKKISLREHRKGIVELAWFWKRKHLNSVLNKE